MWVTLCRSNIRSVINHKFQIIGWTFERTLDDTDIFLQKVDRLLIEALLHRKLQSRVHLVMEREHVRLPIVTRVHVEEHTELRCNTRLQARASSRSMQRGRVRLFLRENVSGLPLKIGTTRNPNNSYCRLSKRLRNLCVSFFLCFVWLGRGGTSGNFVVVGRVTWRQCLLSEQERGNYDLWLWILVRLR